MMFRRFITSNSTFAIVSPLCAFIIWNMCTQEAIIERTISIPVYVQQTSATNCYQAPESVNVTLKGKYNIMRNLENNVVCMHISD